MPAPKVLIWDIESTNLNATFGTILCIGYKFLGDDRVHVPTILDYAKNGMTDDRGLVERFAKIYEHADYTVAHYGLRFDLPMVRTKLLKYGLPPLSPKPLVDTWRVARRELKLHSNRLAVLSEFLGVEHSKTPIVFDDWLKAALGDKKALKSVVHHCKLDVLVLEEVFLKLRPLAREEPVRRLFVDEAEMSCISCGGGNLHQRGYAVSKTRRYMRYQCQECGKWQRNRFSEQRAEFV
jgi:uncharacterized protein YprB with RNaseH-like and TPR domain